MDSLSKKLQALGVKLGTSELAYPKPDPGSPTLVDILPGKWLSTPFGETFVVSQDYPLDHTQGEVRIYPQSPLDPIGLWVGDEGLSGVPLDKFIFIDTETTGLSGGTGTYTFLIGAGRFLDNAFRLNQYFMRDPAEEAAQLAALEAFLAPAQVIVSYNGKAFDLPRLNTRFRAHGWPPPLEDVIHLDLLHLTRRLYNSLLESCTLGSIEYSLLQFTRKEDDVPGWQVADLFFDYLQTGDPSPLTKIYYHNDMDVVSMPALLNLLSHRLANPFQPGFEDHPDLLPIGKFYKHLGKFDFAEEILSEVISSKPTPDNLFLEGLKELSFIYKKKRLYDRAIPLWEQAAGHGEIYASIELAKVYEHHLSSPPEAIHWTLTALDICRGDNLPEHKAQSLLPQLKHRLQRLKTKHKKSC